MRLIIRCTLMPLALVLPALSGAQVRASEPATVSQTVDGTTIAVAYSRPRARERDLFGNPRVVPWDQIWTPGANWATTVDVNRDVRIAGQPVKRGTYSMWMKVRPGGDWTLLLDTVAHRFHTQRPDSSTAAVRAAVRAEEGPFTEVLTWSFPEVKATGAVLAMQWGTKRVAIDVAVEPSLRMEMAEADAAPYLGRYEYTATPLDPGRKANTFVVRYENGVLKGEWEPLRPFYRRFALIPVARDWFVPGLYDQKGELYDVLRPDMTFEFERVAGRPTSFEIRSRDDKLIGSGVRRD